jgi:hypothetical protein
MIYMSTRMAAASHCARPRPRLTTMPPAEEVELWKKVSAGGTVVVALCLLNFLAAEHQHFDKPPPFPYLRIRNKVRRHIGALTARPDGNYSHPSPPPPPPPLLVGSRVHATTLHRRYTLTSVTFVATAVSVG